MSESGFPIPPSLIALLPLMSEVVSFILDRFEWAGEPVLRRLVDKDTRPSLETLPKPQREGIFKIMAEYFMFGERANRIIRTHIIFLLSIWFAAVEHSRDLLHVSGWPVLGLAIVGVSLVVFVLRLGTDKLKPASDRIQLPFWRSWCWLLFICILAAEISERWGKA